MKRIATLSAVVAAVALVLGNVVASAGPRGETIHVISHALELAGIDADGSGDFGDAFADSFTARSEMRDEADQTVVGGDQVTCSLTDVETATWHCAGTTTFDGAGSITYQGSFVAEARSVLAITGGTGDYRGAGGWVVFKPLVGEDYPFDCAYHLLP